MNLLAAADHLASLEWSAPGLDSKRCLHALDKYSTCEACFAVCPVNAIGAGKPPTLNVESCEDCLACLPVCPTGAFTGDDAVSALLTAAARTEMQTIELVCELHPAAETGSPEAGLAIRVRGCLAGIGVGAYLALIALEKSKVIVRSDACAGCRFAFLQPRIEAQFEAARQLLQAWGYRDVLANSSSNTEQVKVMRPVWEADNPPLSRRDLFKIASRQGQAALARALAQDDDDPAQRRLPRERQRLLKSLAHLPPGREAGDQSVTVQGFAALTVAASCTACGACARACPTGALEFVQEADVQFRLNVTPQLCIGCELCAHVCAPAALTVVHNPTLNDVFGGTQPVLLHAGALRPCEGCGARFASQSNARLCPICEFRQNNPFGSRPVPGMRKVRS